MNHFFISPKGMLSGKNYLRKSKLFTSHWMKLFKETQDMLKIFQPTIIKDTIVSLSRSLLRIKIPHLCIVRIEFLPRCILSLLIVWWVKGMLFIDDIDLKKYFISGKKTKKFRSP
eukprot:Sdes_comp9938_c0_seq1m1488